MADTHRLFFALNPGPQVRDSLVSIQSQMADGKARAISPERIHATLIFLGHHPSGAIHVLKEQASQIEVPPSTVTLDRIGWFPRAGVSWIGSSEVPGDLQRFQSTLAGKIDEAGIAFDKRPWKFHITLYREMRKRPATIPIEPIFWPLESFELMESVSDSKGLRYDVLARFGSET